MFKAARFKKVLVISMVLVLTLGTIAVAANEVYQKQLTATFGRIKFKVDGKDVTKEIEDMYDAPAFVVDGRSYVPVRAIAELMGLEVEWDGETHTAEIIDVKSKAYEEAIKKKDQEIAALKKEIEKLKEKEKKEEVKETDIKALQKKLNDKFGTYEGVEFDIALKESKNRIDVDITINLRDGRQESYWNRMRHSDRKAMLEDIVDIILSEFSDTDIYGSIYDEYFRRYVLTFNQRKNSSLNISYDSSPGYYYRDIEDIVYYEFDIADIDVYVNEVDIRNYDIYLDIELDVSDEYYEKNRNGKIIKILDRISEDILYYYGYDYGYYDDRVTIDIYVGEKYKDRYIRYWGDNFGDYTR